MSHYLGWRGIFAGLNSAFASLATGLGGPADAATSVHLVERRAPMSTDTLKAWSEHAVYSRLCAAMPGAALSGGAPPAGGVSIAVLTDDGEPEPAQTARLTAQAEDLALLSMLLNLFTASLREGVSGLWLLDASADQREPLNPETCSIGRLHVLNRFDMTPRGEIVSDAMSPFYGWPEFVEIAPRMGNRRAEPVVCHVSRVVLVAGLKPISTYNKTQDSWDGYGRPLCSMLGDSIKYAETGVITGAGLVQRIQQRVLKLNPKTMSEAKVNRTIRELIEARVALMAETQSTQGVVMLMQDETFESVNARVEGFDSLVKTLTDHLVMQWGIPRAIVTGEQVGGLTASSAPYMDAWGLRVNAYRGEIAPVIEYVARCLLSTIGAPGSNFRVEWAALTPANALTDAQADNAKAQTAAVLVQSGVLGVDTAAEWLRAQGVDLPEDVVVEEPVAGEEIAAALGAEGEPVAVDPAAAVSAEGVAPVTAEPKEPYPVGFVSAALEAAKAVKSGEVDPSQVRGILTSMMGVDPAGAEKIAPDSAAPTGVTLTPKQQSNSTTDAAPADSLWIGAVPASEVWQERLDPLRAAVAEALPGFEPDLDPHLTVLYLGAVAGDVVDLAVEEAQRAVRRMLAEPGVVLPAFHGSVIGFMLPDKSGRQAVALIGEAWGLYDVRDDLQAVLGDLIAPDVRRFPTWRPHVTLGYVPNHRDVTPAQRERVGGIMYRRDYEDVVLPISLITVRADSETPIAFLKTFDAETYQPPKSAQGNARKVLRWREEHGDDVQGMTSAGWIRASQLARGEPVSREIVGKIASFARHRENYEAAAARVRSGESEPWTEPAYVAWLGWGGDTGIEWAQGIVDGQG